MKTSRFLALAALLSVASLRAQTPMSPRAGAAPNDLVVEFSRAGKSDINEGSVRLGQISTSQARVAVVNAMTLDEHNQFLIGAGAQQFEFSPPATSLVPARLGSVALKVGWNHALSAQWSFRAEADPGSYGAGSFGAPIAVRAIFAASRELQWAMGVNYDARSGHPLVGGIGVRWQFAPDWMLAFLLPAPRVEWAVTKEFSLYAGASLRGGTFRVADDFGRNRGRPAFDGETVDYREINLGIGARWQLTPGTAVHVGVGRMTDRRFEFHDRNLLLNGDGAPAGQLTVTSVF